MSAPLVSVLTPAYNAAGTLEACVASVRGQNYENWEHVVVDDGSTDATPELIARLARDGRLRPLRQANARQGAARNAGLRIARGRYVALLDADDEALAGRLETQVAFLERQPEISVLGGGIVDVDAAGRELGRQLRPADHDRLVGEIFTACPFFASTVMARREFFEALGGFDPAMPPAEDYDLWLRGYRLFRYANLQLPLARYRRRPMTLSNVTAAGRAIVRAAWRERRPWLAAFALRPSLGLLARRLGFRGGSN